MSKIFTDAQVQHFKNNVHPNADLMEMINGHTNSLSYAAETLEYLAQLAKENLEAEQAEKKALFCGGRANK